MCIQYSVTTLYECTKCFIIQSGGDQPPSSPVCGVVVGGNLQAGSSLVACLCYRDRPGGEGGIHHYLLQSEMEPFVQGIKKHGRQCTSGASTDARDLSVGPLPASGVFLSTGVSIRDNFTVCFDLSQVGR